MKYLTLVLLVLSFVGMSACRHQAKADKKNTQNDSKHVHSDAQFEIQKTDEQWKKELEPLAYEVLREHGTERAFTGKYHDLKKEGKYYCKACNNLLFSSEHKYDSKTGWPSFYKPHPNARIGTKVDNTFFMERTEVHCARCGGHLGHVFDDGPEPTGLRYCINSVSLTFEPADPQQ